jgi:hypothetical protein
LIPLTEPKGQHCPELIFGTLENFLVSPPKYYNAIFSITCASVLGIIDPEDLPQGAEQKKNALLVEATNQKDVTVLTHLFRGT